VHLLEAVEVEQHDAYHLPLALRARDGALEPVAEQVAIGQPGQRVVLREKSDLFLRLLALGDVVEDDGNGGNLAGRVPDRGNAGYDISDPPILVRQKVEKVRPLFLE